jgi:cytochrome c oxidase subunit 1
MTTSPPPAHNFDTLPAVHALDEFFHRKYEDVGEGDHHDLRQVATADEIVAELQVRSSTPIHLPNPSYWPIVLAFGLPLIAFGVIFTPLIAIVGALIVVLGAFGWALEPSVESDTTLESSPAQADIASSPGP